MICIFTELNLDPNQFATVESWVKKNYESIIFPLRLYASVVVEARKRENIFDYICSKFS